MPIYEYKCTKCGDQFEVNQRMSDDQLTKCESCGGKLNKLISNTSFVLKGSGWYVTDYPSSERKEAMDAKKKPDESKDKKTDASKDKKSAISNDKKSDASKDNKPAESKDKKSDAVNKEAVTGQ
jgi:putative FmdB family regulatory protein